MQRWLHDLRARWRRWRARPSPLQAVRQLRADMGRELSRLEADVRQAKLTANDAYARAARAEAALKAMERQDAA